MRMYKYVTIPRREPISKSDITDNPVSPSETNTCMYDSLRSNFSFLLFWYPPAQERYTHVSIWLSDASRLDASRASSCYWALIPLPDMRTSSLKQLIWHDKKRQRLFRQRHGSGQLGTSMFLTDQGQNPLFNLRFNSYSVSFRCRKPQYLTPFLHQNELSVICLFSFQEIRNFKESYNTIMLVLL